MTEYRWLLPAVLLGEEGKRVRRSARDWVVDGTMFVLACLVALLSLAESRGLSPSPLIVEQITGVLSCAAVWLRRRWPVGLALATVPLTVFFDVVGGLALVALFTVAVHRPFKYVALVGGLLLAAIVPYAMLRPAQPLGFPGTVVLGWTFYLLFVAWGMFVRARRQLVISLRDRAARAAEESRRLERERIAREMHDVLAHRLSLLSVHAGALAFRPGMPPERVTEAAEAIRSSAHQALQDLREVIGVLRRGEEGAAPPPPQPTLADLPTLVEESRRAGMTVRLDMRLPEAAKPSGMLGRTVYRIAQEGLTNARKHAPQAPVRLSVGGAPGEGVTVEIRNPVRTAGRPGSPVPGSGTGLIGVAERVSLAGGRLEHGTDDDFWLRAWLPWAA